MDSLTFLGFTEITKDQYKAKFLNRIDSSSIDNLLEIRELLKDLSYGGDIDSLPIWYQESFNNALMMFMDSYHATLVTQESMNNIIEGLLFNTPNAVNQRGRLYPLPFLKAWKQSKEVSNADVITQYQSEINRQFIELTSSLTLTVEQKLQEIDNTKESVDSSLELVNQGLATIAIRDYAKIFHSQAEEHSITKFEFSKIFPYVKIKFGSAQVWLIVAVILIAGLFTGFLYLDSIIKVNGILTVWATENIVHLVARFVIVSLWIFLISFSFKQYRVNMHLYTMNKHRGNTFQSYERLIKGAKLDDSSHNAILMQVAKSIYEAGHTGYITESETNSDIPSIIDMSKVFTGGK